MHTRFLTLSLVLMVGVIAGDARDAAAQDVDPQKAAACMQAVDGQNYEQVLAACPEVLEVLPEDHPYYAHWAQTVNYAYSLQCQPAFDAQQWDSVIAYCEMAIQANPGAFIMNYFLGVAYQTKQDWPNTAVNFSAFLEGVRGNSQAASQLAQQVTIAERSGGIAYARANAVQDAIPLLQAAAAKNATDVEVHYRLGRALLQAQDSAGAERALSVVLDNDPPSQIRGPVLFLAGQLNYNAGDYAKADARLTAFLETAPRQGASDAHFMLAQALQGSDEDRAISHYQGFLETVGSAPGDPRIADANFALGTIFYNRDDCGNAEQHYRQFMELAPYHDNAAQVTEILASIAEGGCQGG